MLALIVLLPFLGAALPLWMQRWGRDACAWGTALVVALSMILLLSLAPAVFAGRLVQWSWSWIPALGLNASLRLDGLGLLFGLLITGIGLLVVLYARYYLAAHDNLARLYALLLLFMGAMLGIVLADNLLLLLLSSWRSTACRDLRQLLRHKREVSVIHIGI